MKEEFKTFVRTKPELANYVMNKDYTWQQFYEIWDLYGEDHSVWNDYNKQEFIEENPTNNHANMNDLLDMAKNIDMNKVRGGINYAQKALGVLGDFVGKNNTITPSLTKTPGSYIPRPIYRHFED